MKEGRLSGGSLLTFENVALDQFGLFRSGTKTLLQLFHGLGVEGGTSDVGWSGGFMMLILW